MRRDRGQQRAVGAIPPRITPASAVPRPVPPRNATSLPGIWQAEIIELGWGRYRVRFTKDAMAWGPGDHPAGGFVRWGRQRAMVFARRKITMLTSRDLQEQHARRWVL